MVLDLERLALLLTATSQRSSAQTFSRRRTKIYSYVRLSLRPLRSRTPHIHLVAVVLSATLLILVTSLLGLTGTLLNSRPILAFYAILLFPSFVALLIPAYTAYKRASFNLDGKLNLGWSEWWDDQAKLVIQNSVRVLSSRHSH